MSRRTWTTILAALSLSGLLARHAGAAPPQPPQPPAFDIYNNLPQPAPAYEPPGPQVPANPARNPGASGSSGVFGPPPAAGMQSEGPYRAPVAGPSGAPATGGLPNGGFVGQPPLPGSVWAPNDPRNLQPNDPQFNYGMRQTGFQAAPLPEMRPGDVFKPGQIIAWVGDQPIQVGDVMPMIDQMMAPTLSKMPAEQLRQHEAEIEQQKQTLMKQALTNTIETKLLYLDFLRTLPADKKKEILPKINKRAAEQFEEKQLPEAMKKASVNSPAELDAKLRQYGSSLEKQKQSFLERALGQSVLGQKINYEPEITHQDMLDYYRQHAADFDRPAQARWEKLSVRLDRFPSKAAAWEALGNMGAEVWQGAPFAEVAKRYSQGADAGDGGQHNWTTKGSLASEVVDQAIFTLPVGRLSERLEDEREFHIIRVVERRDATRVPFVEAQVEIKEKLKKNKVREQVQAYVAKLKKGTYVWTVFDEKPLEPQNIASPGIGGTRYR